MSCAPSGKTTSNAALKRWIPAKETCVTIYWPQATMKRPSFNPGRIPDFRERCMWQVIRGSIRLRHLDWLAKNYSKLEGHGHADQEGNEFETH